VFHVYVHIVYVFYLFIYDLGEIMLNMMVASELMGGVTMVVLLVF